MQLKSVYSLFSDYLIDIQQCLIKSKESWLQVVQGWATALPMFSLNGLLNLKIYHHFLKLRMFDYFLLYLLLEREKWSAFPNFSLYCHPTSPVYAVTIDFCVFP